MSWLKSFASRTLPWILVLIGIFALLLRITFRDRWFPLSTIYYAFPLPICALLGLVVAAIWRRRLRWHALASLICSLLLLCSFTMLVFELHPHRTDENSIRIVFWNVLKGHLGWEGIADVIAEQDADIIVLVEITPKTDTTRAFWSSRFPEHHVVAVDRSMILLSRFPISDDQMDGLEEMGNVRTYALDLPSGTMDLVHADLKSKPFRSRRPAMEKLISNLAEMDERPTLLMGDFNTPSSSVLFYPLRANFINAFDAAGRGFNVTWPVPVPIMDLDQVWASAHWDILACDIRSSIRSDHRMIVTDLILK